MEEVKHEDVYVVCYQPNGVVIHVPKDVFADVVFEMKKAEQKHKEEERPTEREKKDEPIKYVTYKEGAKMYRMSEKKFREWSNMIGAVKHISPYKVIVSVEIIDEYLKYA